MDIKTTIKSKYGIDIDVINIPKLYKVEDASISDMELRAKFNELRNRWSQGANSPLEQLANSSREHLQNADKYEKILLDKKLLKALIAYYKKEKGGDASTEFAREFFKFIKENNKSIGRADIDFFFAFYSEQLKNKKAIYEMLRSEFKVIGLKEDKRPEQEAAPQTPPKEKKGNSVFAYTRFLKDTLRMLHTCELKYEQLKTSAFLLETFPKLKHSMYDFLGLSGSGLVDFRARVNKSLTQAFDQRQNSSRGSEYIPLTEFYNSVNDVISRKDITEDSFYHFKLLIRYPKFTAHMFLLETIDKDVVSYFVNKLGAEYDFAGEEEFLAVYLKPLIEGDHFACDVDRQLAARMRQIAQNPEELERARKKKQAALNRRRAMPLPVRVAKVMATWPIYLIHYIFEIFNFSIRSIKRSKKAFWIPLALPIVLLNTHAIFDMSLFEYLGQMVSNLSVDAKEVLSVLSDTANVTVLAEIIAYITAIVQGLLAVGLWPAILTAFYYCLANAISEKIDLAGFHNTFMNIHKMIDTKIGDTYKEKKGKTYLYMIWPILANILTVVGLIAAVWFINAVVTGALAPATLV